MSKDLSNVEELVLLAVLAAGEDAYGVTVHDRLERAGHATSLGVIYATLDRLETKGHLSASVGAPTAMRGGRRKRLFRVTRGGRGALSRNQNVRSRLQRAVEQEGT